MTTKGTKQPTADVDAAGESGGGAYPNPHAGKTPKSGGFMGHGGQTEMDYHGPDQLGGEAADGDNPNAAARSED